MEYSEFSQLSKDVEFTTAQKASKEIFEFMSREDIKKRIGEIHKVNAKSHQIQDIILPQCMELGMSSEKKGLFSNYATTQLRPDYYLPIGSSGLIMEVERGKTTTNNMDLLDIWKCHICTYAEYLLLIVPVIRQTNRGGKTKVYEHVVKRISTFFEPQSYVNVKGCFIIGY